jgi:acyl-CoA thioesterase YciA
MVCERPPAACGDTYSPPREGRAAVGGRGSLSETTMRERFPAIRVTMLPRDTNAYGTIFGGVILSYIDLAGGIECRRQSPKKFVTKAMHEVVFVAPVYLGDLVTFYTRTGRIGTTSITVDIEVEAERLGPGGTKEIVRVTEAEVIYVAVSNDGKPVPIN